MIYAANSTTKDRVTKQEFIKIITDIPEKEEIEIFTDEEKNEEYQKALERASRFTK